MKARDMDAVEIVDVDDEEEEEKDCEDWCFVCKDGGSLMLCDYKDCPKVYHASCVEKNISVQNNEESLICMWHSCYLCNKKPKLFCLCCPHAVCQGCVTHAEFIHLKENKGLCSHCQEYVITLEEIQEYDATGDKIDLTDRDTFECLFLEYWEIIKNQESVTFDDVIASKSRKKAAKAKSRYKDDPKFELHHVNSSKSPKKGIKIKDDDDDDDGPEFSLTNYGVDDVEDYKTTLKPKRMEFIGWGSKPLIEFLTSIGEDTREEMSQHTVDSVIRRYIRQKNLLDDEKKNKKKVRCDEKLFSIFRKKYVNQKRIYSLLNAHFKENADHLEYISLLERGFGEKNENVSVPCKKQKTDMSDEETCEEEVKPEMRPTGLAMISADNIKLVYLRKSLVLELLKKSKSFRNKVVGSFVKVRNDPRDPIAFQILQVTDIKSADDKGMFLYLAGIASDVSISRLDDSDITKEEIDDLKQKVMSGLLRQPTLVEMEQKAKALHEDITKHEYLEERELLQKPSEQERLLRQTPKIIEELIEIEQEPPAASSDSSKQGNISGLSREVVMIDID
ncbi:BnaA09g52320D [Brassica napus]|uniref:BnaA09g52320D protein n=1 Tax=Brassica napus TaxID=3708 RepID=A0A078J8G2_BRANA|nr:BnaA09g52320D [Brassica napus]